MAGKPRVLIRGGGDLASGVAARLHRSGFAVLILELPHPLVVRRLVSFAEVVFRGEFQVEDIPVRLAENITEAEKILDEDQVAVMHDLPVVDGGDLGVPLTSNVGIKECGGLD